MVIGIDKYKNEKELIEDCIKNNSKAQCRLYEKYSSKMFAICLRYVKEVAEAEDILIKSFMKVFEKLSTYQHKGSFEGWIRKIVVNEALGFIRSNKTMYLEVDIEKADGELDFSVFSHLEADDLVKLIQLLPQGYRTVFNLYAVEGYSHKEIAELLEISENTSKSQLSRARGLLQKNLQATQKVLFKNI